MSLTIEVKGLRELNRALHALPDKVNTKVLRKSVAPAANMIRDEAQRLVKVDTGRLQQAIIIKRIPGERPEYATYIIVPRHGVKAQKTKKWGGIVDLDAWYWVMLEFGTVKMAARPFLRPAFEAMKGVALDVILNELKTGIDYEATLLAWGTR